jgi:DNA-binding transcriptional regulator YiaG
LRCCRRAARFLLAVNNSCQSDEFERERVGLTQEEFAARSRIPLGTPRDWEQGTTEPDLAARAYLTAIALNPKAVTNP